MKIALAGLAILLLAGCSERYRYPCQDPSNWDSKECQKPFCSANGTCPEDLTHYEKEKNNNNSQSAPQSRKGECK